MTAPLPESNRGRRWTFWLRAAAGLGLVGFLAAKTDWRPVATAIDGMRWEHWLVAVAIYLGSQVVSAWRWGALARPLGFDFPQRRFTQLYFEGMFFSLCLPSSIGGDVVKAYRLAPMAAGRVLAACTVLADRATGLIGLFVIGLTALAARSFDLTLLPALAVGAALLLAALTSVSVGLAILNRFVRLLRPEGRLSQLFVKLLPYHARPEVFRRAIGWGLAVQLLNVLVVVETGRAMGLQVPLVAYFVAVPVVALLTLLPVSVSGVGVREGGLVWMLASYGVGQGMGITLGILWFLVTVAGGLVGGLAYLFGLKESSEAAEQEKRGQNYLFNSSDPFFHSDGAPIEISPALRAKIAGMTLSVVVPVYNERENLPRLYRAITRVMEPLGQPYEIVLVDDGSTDGSGRVLSEMAAQDSRVKIARFRRNFGQTAAINAGIHLASGDAIITLDADLQNDPADIPMMLDKLADGYDLVHGWRKDRQDKFLSRRLPSAIANRLISKSTGFPVHDLGCTLKVIRREIAQELQLYGEMHRFIPILAHWRGARCAEVVTRHHPRQFGASKYGLSRTLRVVLDLVTVKYMTQYLSSPMKLFGMLGLASGLVGLVAGLSTLVMWFDGFHMSRNPLLLLTVFAGFVGLQFFVLGMLGELGVRTYYESQGRHPYAIRDLVNFDQPLARSKTASPKLAAQEPPERKAA
ncbi:MAG TPA: lysylphosphatidylglycerol synthase domain-containing protein [Pirellulales bacterium]|jgi:glycosyltransferase involved in cell wall biosynthesis/uncharacterized membrane protein YbhN (UPF0104 family)|nr:lysylphosphatidylglycerol synthase domain-containing protein [Pirellulales bacterium]